MRLSTIAFTIVALGLAPHTAAQQSNPTVIQMAGQESTDADNVRYPTLCTGADWVVFNAVSKKNGKIVSVCVMEGDHTTPSHLTYRYGKPGKVELSYPATAKGSAKKFTARRYTRAQATYFKFEFTTKGYNYEILDGAEGNDTDTGLRVIRVSDGKVVAEHDLAPDTKTLSLMALEDLVKTAPFDE